MDIALAKKFIMEFLEPQDKLPLIEIFDALEKNPMMILHNSTVMMQLECLRDKDKRLALATGQGMVAGFALASAMKYPEVRSMMQGYIDHASKSRGENVINFLHRK